MEPDNPYTYLEGYKLYDASDTEVGEVEQTIYDVPSDVLKYIVVNGRAIPAERIEVKVERESVYVPFERETIETAPRLEEISGEFDRSLHEHYESRG